MISPDIKFKVRNSEEIKDINETIPNCHYLHTDETTAAALSFCEQNQMVSSVITFLGMFHARPMAIF